MPAQNDDDRLLRREEAAEILNLSPQTLAGWMQNGNVELPYVRVGRSIRYRRSDLEKFIKRNTANVIRSC